MQWFGESPLVTIGAAIAIISNFAITHWFLYQRHALFWFDCLWGLGALIMFVGFAVDHHWVLAAEEVILVLLVIGYNKRKRLKRVAKLVGEKGRAIRRKLVNNLRQLKPRPLRLPRQAPSPA